MPRTTLPPEHDLGFLRLHPNGSVTAAFRINYILVVGEEAEFQGDLRRSQFCVRSPECGPWIPVQFPDDVLRIYLPAIRDACSFFPSELRAAEASNANTGFRFFRHKGVTLLETWRSRRCQCFVHYRASWIETDLLDACEFMKNPPEDVQHGEPPV